MAIPGVTYAEWLQAEALFSESVSAGIVAAWGDDALTSETITALASSAAAATEADRQLLFLAQALAIDVHDMAGRFTPYIGKTITIKCPRLGYDAGVACLVLGAVDDLGRGVSKVTVLRVV